MRLKKTFEFIAIAVISLLSFQLSAQQWTEVNPELRGVVDIISIDDTYYTISNLGDFASSTDNGVTWKVENIKDFATLSNGTFTSVLFFDNNHGLISLRDQLLGNQLLRTVDGGKHWEIMNPDYNDCSLNFIPIDLITVNDSSVIVDIHLSGVYFISHDRGITWTCSDPFIGPGWLQVKVIRSESEWLFNGNDGLYKTVDAGVNWVQITNKHFAHYQEDENGALYGLSWYYDEPSSIPILYKSVDDFETYDSIALVQFKGEYIDLFVQVSEDLLYVRLNGKELHVSIDGGQSFQLLQVLTNEPFKAIQLNKEWYLVGRGLWRLDRIVTDTKETIAADPILVFPNPTANYIMIENDVHTSYELVNNSGSIVQSGLIQTSPIDISTQEKGIYYLKLKMEGQFTVQKIIKL